MLRAMHWYESFICVQKLSEFPCSNRIAPPCTQIRYGAITALNRCENDVLHTTMFLEKLPFCLETAVPVSCLPCVICQHHTIMPHLSVVVSVLGGFCPQISSEIRFPRKPLARFGSNSTIVLTRNQRCALSFVFVRMYSTFTIK